MKPNPIAAYPPAVLAGLLWVLLSAAAVSFASADSPTPAEAAEDREPSESAGGSLQPAALTEGSGLAASRRRPDRFWIHNDSGDGPELYAVDGSGRSTGRWHVQGAEAVDWEDMASFVLDGRPHLLIADVGDNAASRRSVVLYAIEEPDPDGSGQTPVSRRIEVTYPDGPRDCEAVAVDRAGRQIVLVAKTPWPWAGVYGVPLDLSAGVSSPVMARRLTRVAMPMVTAMDIGDDGSLLLAGYFDGFLYGKRSGEQTLAERLSIVPRHVAWPRLRQIEGACFDRHGRVWICSEGQPGRLARVADATEISGEPAPATTTPPVSPPKDDGSGCSKLN